MAERTAIDVALAAQIQRLRNERGWTMERLADAAGVHRTTLGLVERGRRGLSVATGQRIAAALDMSLSHLVKLAEEDADGGDAAQRGAAPDVASN